ncbi:hypothetical protein SAMN02745163_03673 [Clostridium cavendishii DSM 21758]|uniref:Uncharacterized protein n=1 Tax=Clostridium cavendishii DSM 21758 TaxID=1121302 RepID=A0A1M6RUA2_9CLOT|nr:hypothetical protein [Clostridium cavendishii]SHK36091.1 hypothetical protein SAMN02745163_03673 [Clostridium cavendishii DSM 21758]
MDDSLIRKELNITFTTEELNQIFSFVKNPSVIDSIADIKKNLISYTLLEKLDIYIYLNFGKEIVDELEKFIENANYSDVDNFINGLLENKDFINNETNKLIAVILYIYCIHKINKRENSYKLN